MLLLLLLRGLLIRGLERRLICLLALLVPMFLPVTRSLVRFTVFAPPLITMMTMFTAEASPEGGGHRGCPIALFLVRAGSLGMRGLTWERWGWMILYSAPRSSTIRSSWRDGENVYLRIRRHRHSCILHRVAIVEPSCETMSARVDCSGMWSEERMWLVWVGLYIYVQRRCFHSKVPRGTYRLGFLAPHHVRGRTVDNGDQPLSSGGQRARIY